jgi:hypothetical protein
MTAAVNLSNQQHDARFQPPGIPPLATHPQILTCQSASASKHPSYLRFVFHLSQTLPCPTFLQLFLLSYNNLPCRPLPLQQPSFRCFHVPVSRLSLATSAVFGSWGRHHDGHVTHLWRATVTAAPNAVVWWFGGLPGRVAHQPSHCPGLLPLLPILYLS